MENIIVHIINQSPFGLPAYATPGSAGLDLRAHLEEPVHVKSLGRVLIPTGIRLGIPAGYEGQVRPRSGMALKQGITCLNSPGTIDSDYRGEIKVLLVNLSGVEQTIHPGERIAQIVFSRVAQASWAELERLSETERNEGGFGHTGIQ